MLPPNTTLRPAVASSTTTLSHAILPTFVILPSLTLSDVPTIPVNEPAAALLAPIVVPSDPPSILAVVTVPRSAIVVPLKVEFLPKIICSLSFVVLNLMYELLPSVILSASARLSVSVILFLLVFPPNTTSRPAVASSTTTLSHAILPTFVILPSLTLSDVPTIPVNEPAALLAPIIVPSIDPPLISAVVATNEAAVVIPSLSTVNLLVPSFISTLKISALCYQLLLH